MRYINRLFTYLLTYLLKACIMDVYFELDLKSLGLYLISSPLYYCVYALFMQIRIHESPTANPAYNMQKSDWETTELLEVHMHTYIQIYIAPKS